LGRSAKEKKIKSIMGRDSSVGIATRYGLDGPVIESVKRLGRGVDHPPHVAPRLRKEYSYTSFSFLGFRDSFYGEIYILLYFIKSINRPAN